MAPLRVIFAIISSVFLFSSCHGQLLFTPSWGKRNNLFPPTNTHDGQEACDSSEVLMDIFRFVQMEAQSLEQCHQK